MLWLRLYQGSATCVFRPRCHSEEIFFRKFRSGIDFFYPDMLYIYGSGSVSFYALAYDM